MTQKKLDLRRQAHALNPVVMIGNKGYTPAITAEIELALNTHELIKIKIQAQDKADRNAIATAILADVKAELIQTIGHIIVIYRQRKNT